MVTEEDLTLGGGHRIQYTDDVSKLYTGHLCIVLTSVTPINIIFKKWSDSIYNLRIISAEFAYVISVRYREALDDFRSFGLQSDYMIK